MRFLVPCLHECKIGSPNEIMHAKTTKHATSLKYKILVSLNSIDIPLVTSPIH